ncbi:QRFP-like peptide receptor [Montipora foliosa]|uniref:QRFP-like peptide receptor n=1 Tax=Montipora foliosa TaxID=591990 RepID=UPI0035F12BF5
MNINTSFSRPEAIAISGQDVVFAVLYSSIILPGVLGNCIIITIVRKTPSMQTTTNYLLMNLAVADLVTLLLCPGLYDFALTSVRLQGFTGDLICKLFSGNAIVPISMNAGVLTVCTIAVERYLALVKPFHTRLRMSKESVGRVIVFLWILAVLSCIPDIKSNTVDVSSLKYHCKRPWSLDEYIYNKPFIIFTSVCFGFISCLVVFFCYFEIVRGLFFTRTICSQSTRNSAERQANNQLARLLIWLSVFFAICSLPFSIYFIFLVFSDTKTVRDNYDTLYLWHRISRLLVFANSFCNPILYALQSSNYRESFKILFNERVNWCNLFRNNFASNDVDRI